MGLLNGDFYTCSVWPQDGICNISLDGATMNYVKKELTIKSRAPLARHKDSSQE